MARYTVVLDNMRGTRLEVKHGVRPAPTDRLVVADGFDLAQGFSDDQVPGPMEPETISFQLAARDKSALPPLRSGDLWRVTVTLHGAHDVQFYDDVCRLSTADVELRPRRKWAVLVDVVLVGLLADLRSRFADASPRTTSIAGVWLADMIEYGLRDVNLWAPLEWIDHIALYDVHANPPRENAADQITKFAAGVPAGDMLTTLRSRWSTAEPDPERFYGQGIERLPDTTNPLGFVLQPIATRVPAGAHLPYVLTDSPAGVTVSYDGVDPADSDGLAIVPGCAVTVPAKARRARDTSVNTHVIGGQAMVWHRDELDIVNFETEESTVVISRANGSDSRRTRQIDTLTYIRVVDEQRIYPADMTAERNNQLRRAFAAAYTVDDGAIDAEWSYDALALDLDLLSDAELSAIAPLLSFAGPEDLDGIPNRSVVVTDVDPDVDLSGRQSISGTLTSAQFSISGGKTRMTLRLSPGTLPLAEGAGVSAADLLTSPWPTATPLDLDPDVNALDMRLVRRNW